VSFEVLAQNCPAAWQQRAADGSPALTGWSLPSALLSPAKAEAVAWLATLAQAYVGLMVDAQVAPRLQVGEPCGG
jgi:hypothetical protein